jgi:hypothetical protein
MEQVKFITALGEIVAELRRDCSPETIEILLDFLPMKYTVPLWTWGQEVFFFLPDALKEKIDFENAKTDLQIWDVAYWVRDPAICLFYGRTPLSRGKNPVAAEPINVIGRIVQGKEILLKLRKGDLILMIKA